MEVILRQDVDELGLEGDIVDVAKGHARNYLVPKGIALEATLQNRKALESVQKGLKDASEGKISKLNLDQL